MSFYVHIRSFRLKIGQNVNFSNFQAEEFFSFSKFLGHLNEKGAAATPPSLPRLTTFSKIWPEYVLEIKIKIHKVWAS